MRANSFFRNATLVYVLESNLGNEHLWVDAYLNTCDVFENVYALREAPGQLGFRTDAPVKRKRAMLLSHCFAMDSIAICDQFVSVKDPRAMLDTLITQIDWMREYHRTTSTGETTEFTAIFDQAGNRIPNRRDDAVQALMVALDIINRWTGGRTLDREKVVIDAIAARRSVNSIARLKRGVDEFAFLPHHKRGRRAGDADDEDDNNE
jgi:hypothetical protein